MSPQAKETKARINTWVLIKLKSFSPAKETTNKMKRPSTKWEKIFANDISDKGLKSQTWKELIQRYVKKKQKPG